MNTNIIKTVSPGKIILSGEFSILYNFPILAFAINRHVFVTIKKKTSIDKNFRIFLNIQNFDLSISLDKIELLNFVNNIEKKYQKYCLNKIGFTNILREKHYLSLYTIGYILKPHIDNINYDLIISINSTIPYNLGLGSSAATINALILALTKIFNIKLKNTTFINLAKNIENLQHGHSSGSDIITSLNGGCSKIYKESNKIFDKKIHFSEKAFSKLNIINTGITNNTSESVNFVKKHFKPDHQIWKAIANITRDIETNLTNNMDIDPLLDNIRENNKLLSKLGIVPQKIQNFINQIVGKNIGGAAKISGSGNVRGSSGGIVISFGEKEKIARLVDIYRYELINLKPDFYGTRII